MWQRIKNVYHLLNAIVANFWFGFPSRRLTVIGVTGTDGKTTTTSLIYHILHTAGYNASMVSSVGAIIGGKTYDVGFHVTTPSPWALQRFISLCHPEIVSGSPSPQPSPSRGEGEGEEMPKQGRHDNKDRYLVLETTSHAIDQNRIWGTPFDIGVLTNVTHEHLDYHKTYENYVKTKAKLLRMSEVVIVNRDDNSFTLIKSEIPLTLTLSRRGERGKRERVNQRFITYGMTDSSDVNPQKFLFKTNLIGEFNRYNVLAAIGACQELGISDEAIREAILTFKPPIGRGEIVYPSTRFAARRASSGQGDFTVMIDFAHTPNAFEEILSAVKPSIKGRLIHVFGAAGLRDVTKRPLMAQISSKYSDVIVLTAEDPRSESVKKIMDEIASGIQNSKFKIQNIPPHPNPLPQGEREKGEGESNKKYVFEIPNRQEAINAAIKMARRGDFVLITGKGHEKSMNYGKGEEPWDEFEAVKKAFRNLSGRSPRRSPFGHLRGVTK